MWFEGSGGIVVFVAVSGRDVWTTIMFGSFRTPEAAQVVAALASSS